MTKEEILVRTNGKRLAVFISAVLLALTGLVVGILQVWPTGSTASASTSTGISISDQDRMDSRYESKEMANQRYQTVIGRLDDIKTEQAETRALLARILDHCDRQQLAQRTIP
jgi:hypothetical protein